MPRFVAFDPGRHSERSVERTLGNVRDELQRSNAYRGKTLQVGYFKKERKLFDEYADTCWGFDGTVCGIAEEQSPVEEKYLWGLRRRHKRPLRTVLGVGYDLSHIMVIVEDEAAREIAYRHLNPYAEQNDFIIIWTSKPN